LIGDKALLVGVVLVLTGPVLVHTTMRSMLIREHGDWRAVVEKAREEDSS
jgi:multisubunit Na+/H+ antiporter MnhG subunit